MAPFKVGNNHGAVCATPLKTTLQHQHDEDMVKTVKKSKKKAKHPEVVAQQIIKRPAPYSEPELCTTNDDFQDRLPVVANPATPRKKTRITVADVHDICHAQTIHLTGMIGRLEDKLDQLLESNFAPAGGTTAPVDSSAVKAAPKEKKEKLPPVSYALFTKHARPSAVKLIEDSGHKASMAMGWPNSMMNNMQNIAAFPPSTLAYMPWFPQMAQMGQLGMAYPGMGAIPAVAAGGATGPVLGGSDDAQRKRRERDETNMKWASLDALAPPASCEPAHPRRARPRYRAFITPLPPFPAPTPRAMAKPELTELSSAAPACSDPGWQPITVTSFGAYQTRGT